MGFKKTVAIIAISAAPLAYGQDAKDWEGEAELGVLMTSGNTEETNINGRLGLVHEVVNWRNIAEFSSIPRNLKTKQQPRSIRAPLRPTTSLMKTSTGSCAALTRKIAFPGTISNPQPQPVTVTAFGTRASVHSLISRWVPVIATTNWKM